MDCPYFMDAWDGSQDGCKLDGRACLGYCDIAAELDDEDYEDYFDEVKGDA